MYHILYRTTNLVNNRFYVGMHSTKKLDDEYLGSGKRLKAELRKYGRENFKREIIEVLPTRKELQKREAQIVNEELLKNPLCLNLKIGGEGNSSSDAKRLWSDPDYQNKIRLARKETWNQPGYREMMGATMKRALDNPETKKKLQASGLRQNGKRKHTEEFKQRLSKRVRTPEERKKISDAIKLWHQQRAIRVNVESTTVS